MEKVQRILSTRLAVIDLPDRAYNETLNDNKDKTEDNANEKTGESTFTVATNGMTSQH